MGVTSDAHRFLTALWGPKPPGLIQVWRLGDRRSFYPRAAIGAAGLIDGETDVYIGVACAGQDHGRYKRAKADQAVAIAGLWLDIDVNGGPDNKTGAAPDKDTAIGLAHDLMPPTLIVDSGYGIHAWYLFDAPWHFKNLDDQAAAALASEQWFALHRTAAGDRGFSIDHAHDLARLMRPPGALNGKGGEAVPVTFIRADGPRYGRDELLARAGEAGDIVRYTGLSVPGDAPVVDIGPARVFPLEKLNALIENSDEFRRSWTHSVNTAWSMSEYDLSLCSIAAQAGLNDQELADLIACHRRTADPNDPKADRPDYVRRTVAKARQSSDRAGHVDWFKHNTTRPEIAA